MVWEIIKRGRPNVATGGGMTRGAGGGGSFFAMDIETWERNHDLLTEVGYSYIIVRPNGSGRPGTNETREDNHIGTSGFPSSFTEVE